MTGGLSNGSMFSGTATGDPGAGLLGLILWAAILALYVRWLWKTRRR